MQFRKINNKIINESILEKKKQLACKKQIFIIKNFNK